MTEPRPRSSTRLRAAIALSAAGLLLTAGLGTALVLNVTSTVQGYAAQYSAARAAEPQPVASGATSSPLPTAAATADPRLPYEQPTPTAAPDGHLYDQWGARLYGVADTIDDFTYPDTLVGDELTNARSWFDMQLRIAACMENQGHDYTFQLYWESSTKDKGSGLPAPDSEAWAALYGDNLTSSGPYDWTSAGCHGRIVHEMGNDDAN